MNRGELGKLQIAERQCNKVVDNLAVPLDHLRRNLFADRGEPSLQPQLRTVSRLGSTCSPVSTERRRRRNSFSASLREPRTVAASGSLVETPEGPKPIAYTKAVERAAAGRLAALIETIGECEEEWLAAVLPCLGDAAEFLLLHDQGFPLGPIAAELRKAEAAQG